MSEVYKKVGGRYKSIGHEFIGFPANGIWLVQDGSQNCLLQLSDIPKVPHGYLSTAQYMEECMNKMFEKIDAKEIKSIYDVAEAAAMFYAEKLEEKGMSN